MRAISQELENSMLWNNKPILKNSLLVWDVENISIKALPSIKHLAKFTPQKCFAISKVPLDALKAAILLKEGFNLYILNTDWQVIDLYTQLFNQINDFVGELLKYLAYQHVLLFTIIVFLDNFLEPISELYGFYFVHLFKFTNFFI